MFIATGSALAQVVGPHVTLGGPAEQALLRPRSRPAVGRARRALFLIQPFREVKSACPPGASWWA
ncbi:hypothetical protein, partial [Streptomyces sp. NPDC000618]|uniref:hypothetical protein n=1 Tax=Streptomyces sp. NPDC000618 TaxID=3154265 RepID=UPI0033309DBA